MKKIVRFFAGLELLELVFVFFGLVMFLAFIVIFISIGLGDISLVMGVLWGLMSLGLGFIFIGMIPSLNKEETHED